MRLLALLISIPFLSFTLAEEKSADDFVKMARQSITVSPDSCEIYLNEALKIFDQDDNLLGRIKAINGTASKVDMAGHTNLAITLFEKSTLPNLPRKPNNQEEWKSLGWLYTSLGYTYAYSAGNYDKAKETYELAALFFEDNNLDSDPYVAKYVFQELGNIYTRQGDYEAAEITLNKFKNISLQNQDFNATAEAFSDLGIVYEHREQDSLAIKSYLNGLDLPSIHMVPRALLEGNLSQIYLKNEDVENAFFWAEKARKSFETIDENQWHYEAKVRLANIHNLLGNIAAKKDQFKAAESHLKTALQIMRVHFQGDTLRREFGKIHFALGGFYLERERHDLALLHHQKALKTVLPSFKSDDFLDNPAAKTFYAENVIMDALEGKADAFFEKYNLTNNPLFLKKALECHDLIFEAEEVYRKVHRYQSSKLSVIEGSRYRSENAIKVALRYAKDFGDENMKNKAFSFAEKSKSVLLFEALKHSNAKSVANIPNSVLDAENELIESITDLEKELFDLKNQEEIQQHLVDSIENKILETRKAYNNLIAKIEKDYPSYYQLKYGKNEISIAQIQEGLGSKQAMIEYFVGAENIFIFLIKKDTYEVIALKKDYPLEAWVNQFRKDIEQFQFDQKQALCESYSELAFKLYEALILPVENLVLPENLILIPSGILDFLPFDALLKSKPKQLCQFNTYDYFLNHHNVVYNYSAVLWKELLDRNTGSASHDFLGFAPEFGKNNNSGFGELKYNIETLVALQDLIEGDILLAQNATRINFENLAQEYKILHFATHAKANSEEGDFSFIVLAKPDGTYDTLYVKDIYNQQLSADLVFLGACETGFGRLHTGEGVISLARSFLYAGANSVLTTLWSVNDQMTKKVALDFYENLKDGHTKNDALWSAKRNHIATENMHPNFAHPVFWAAYVPVGNMTQVYDNQVLKTILFVLGIIFLGFILVVRNQYSRQKNGISNLQNA